MSIFPKHEWHIYKKYLKTKERISILRIGEQYQKYKFCEIYNTEWGYGQFKVIKSELFSSFDEVLSNHLIVEL